MALRPDSEKSRADELAERQTREQEVLFREVDDAVRQDQLGGAAKKYGIPVAVGIVLALAAFGGWLWWTEHQEGVKEQRSEQLITAFDKLEAGQVPQADKDLAALAGERSDAQAVSAKLARAGIALNQNRHADAVKLYEEVSADGDAPQAYRDLATIRSMAAQFDQLEPQKVIDRLKPLATPGNPWFGSAGELVGMAYLKQNKPDLAGPLFAAIAKDETVPKSLRSRTRQMAGLLGVDAVVDVDKTLAEVREQEGGAPAAQPAQ
ncbi:MAG: tetratricopeptide repeat protein [Porphyrobacter sp.]|nr:tetratricopeptide repeat protein [Porphyrobacter sp.]